MTSMEGGTLTEVNQVAAAAVPFEQLSDLDSLLEHIRGRLRKRTK